MAYDPTLNEKAWHFRHNQNCNGSSDYTMAQNWLYHLFLMISGGNGNSDAAWTIVSSSDGALAASNASRITSPTSFLQNGQGSGSEFGWFMAKKTNGPIPAGDMYFGVGLDQADSALQATFFFDREEPMNNGTTVALPTSNGNRFSQTGIQFCYGYNASFPTYFNGMINTTGSFWALSSRLNGGYCPTTFVLAAQRLETPRSSSVDPYPVWMKCAYENENQDTGYYGAWKFSGPLAIGNTSDGLNCDWATAGGTGQAMWRVGGSATTSDDINLMLYGTAETAPNADTYAPGWINYRGSDIDGTWPLLPCFVGTGDGACKNIRGRIPDLHQSWWALGTGPTMEGGVIPQVGTPAKSCIACWWLPSSASFLPGNPNAS